MPWSKRLFIRETLTVYGASTYAGGVTYSGAATFAAAATFQSTVGITGLLSLATGAAGGLKIGADCFFTRGAAGITYMGQTAGGYDAEIKLAGMDLDKMHANTNDVQRALTLSRRVTSGSGANGAGTGIAFNIEDTGGVLSPAGNLDVYFTDATGGSEDTAYQFAGASGGVQVPFLEIRSTGTGAILACADNSTYNLRQSLQIDDSGVLTQRSRAAANNSVLSSINLQRYTTNAAHGANGIGTGITFSIENNNDQCEEWASLQASLSNAADGAEEALLVFYGGTGGAAPTETMRIAGGGGTSVVTIAGNLIVSGTTFTADVANVLIEDKIITLNNGGAAASGGGVGLEVEEDAVITAYFKQAAARTGWELTSSAAPTRILSIITPTAASESLTMSGSLNVELDSAINQDLTTDASATLANLDLSTGGALRTKTTAGNTLLLQAYNTNAGVLAYQTVGTLTTGDPPTFDLWTSTTLGTAYIYRAGGTDVPVADGGTGVSTFGGANTLLYTSAADTLTSLVAVNDGALVSSHVGLPTWLGPLTNGQVVIGSTGAIPVAGAITGTANQITVTLGAGTIALSGPQDLAAASSPTFAGLTLSGATQNGAPYFGAGGIITSTGAMTDGQLLVGDTGSNPILATLTGTANRVTVTNGAGSITLSGPQDLATTSAVTFGSVTAGTTPAPGAIQGNLKLQFFMGNPTVGTDNVFEELGNVIGTWAASAANFLVTAAAAPGGGRGSANSLHFACAGAALDGDYCSDARASVNWGGADQAGFWIYSVEGIAAGDVNFYVYDGTPGTTNEIDVGAVTAGVWTYVRVSLAGFTIADVDRLGFMLTAQGAAKTFTFDVNWISRWDETNTIALPQQVLYGSIHGVYYTGDQAADVHTAVTAVENTNYIINYNATGNEFISLTNLSAQILFMTYSYV